MTASIPQPDTQVPSLSFTHNGGLLVEAGRGR
jgi:hypothetical protein